MQKRWSMLAGVTLLTALLAGCSGGEPANEPQGEAPAQNHGDGPEKTGSEAQDGSEAGSEFLAAEEPTELTLHLHLGNTIIYDDDWMTFQKAAELTNIELKGTASETSTNSEEMFNIMIASGDMPDIVAFNKKDTYNELGMDGAFVPLNDLIEEHAPHIQAFLEERPDVRRFATAPDGNIYFLNFVPDGEAASGWFIRQDWLDALQLDVPTTVDEYYAVLKAFREQDPNGNGKQDEIPYFNRSTVGVNALMIMWQARGNKYVEDGKVKFGPYEPAFETALTEMAKWYAEGLIDPEIYTRGGKARDILLGDDVGGSTHDWFGSTAGYNNIVKEKWPDFAFLPIAPPAGTDGVIREETKRAAVGSSGWGISSSSEHQVEAIKYFDFWFTETGRRLMNFGVEGVHYDMQDGQPIFKDEILNNELGALARLQQDGAQIEIAFHQNFDYEKQWMDEIALKGVQEYMDNGYAIDPYPQLAYTNEEKERINTLYSAIKTYVDETMQKWVLGVEPVGDNIDAFRAKLKSMGVEEMVELEQQAYDRYVNG
ncbi:extracellular solute-binding protein [Paenibacillus sp. IB182496]|uniref:Extracellular solute-binding protein n=1 Tax=Paenibacillus sabuli TaxID=2772509 RepID=A0A927BVW6_9BACL|nr:extracellular solute-binding protein [Paenibacillus sabuli]MBD2846323.1 extracellular solute-binding protein [Paenibacillus sabuli]